MASITPEVGIILSSIYFPHRYLRDNFKIIDPTKICAYGWGYGAYITSILLTKDTKRTFLCYIAVAPIVSFPYYSEYARKIVHN
jgi:dipeptidyl aminopeptidase/acylaminoacyl peptidase